MLPTSVVTNTVLGLHSARTVDEMRLQILRKYKKEILDKVKFGDVSQSLIACGMVSKEECFEICKLASGKQMSHCFQKVHDIMDILICQMGAAHRHHSSTDEGEERHQNLEEKQSELVKDVWNNFLKALKIEHSQLAYKIAAELDKYAENKINMKRRGSTGTRIKKEDIGVPTSFHHIQHSGLISRAKSKSVDVVSESSTNADKHKGKAENFEELDENNADLQEFFKRAGVLSRHLTNPVTRNIIFKFIEGNGGMVAIRKEVRKPPKLSLSESNLTSTRESQTIPDISQTFTATSIAPPTEEKESSEVLSPPPPPQSTTVPFEPTPKPILNYF